MAASEDVDTADRDEPPDGPIDDELLDDELADNDEPVNDDELVDEDLVDGDLADQDRADTDRADTDRPGNDRSAIFNQRTFVAVGVGLTLALMAYIMFQSRVLGHWWGDDWALYIRQAQGLRGFDPGRVARQNAFTVENSRGGPFSPPIYPWGYPAVLAVFINFLGTDVDRLAIVSMLAALVWATAWFFLARPRIRAVPAMVGMIAVCLTPQYLGWVDLVQSEYVFMAAVGVFLVALDRMVRHKTLLSTSTKMWHLIGLGVLAEFAFEVRREGLATIAAIGAAHLVVVSDRLPQLRSAARSVWQSTALRLAAPYASFALVALAVKWVLPSVLVPRYEGAGIGNVWRYRAKHAAHFADLLGIKASYAPDPEILGSVTAGKIVFWLWVAILVVGLILAFTRWRRRDAHLAAYAIVAFVIGCSAKAALSRYFASVVPIASLLVLVTISSGTARAATYVADPAKRRTLRKWAPVVAVLAVLLPMSVANLINARKRVELNTAGRESGYIQWGAQHPDAQEMFRWVREHTEPTDVVASFKARSMVLEAFRNSVQVDDYRPLDDDLDVALVVEERSSPAALKFEERSDWVEVWSNDRLIVFAPADSELARSENANNAE